MNSDSLRTDLFFRLSVVSLYLPPLRNRKEDIPLLCDRFIKNKNPSFNTVVSGLSPELLELLNAYAWPGNVRELENLIEASMNFVDMNETTLSVEHIPKHILANILKTPAMIYPEKAPAKPKYQEGMSLTKLVRDFEKQTIEWVLAENDWNVTKAAQVLGILRQNLYHKLKYYHIERP